MKRVAARGGTKVTPNTKGSHQLMGYPLRILLDISILWAALFISLSPGLIAHSVHILSQFVCLATSVHFGHLLHMLGYLCGHHLRVYSMLVIVHFSFMLTRTPLGRVTQQIDIPSLVSALFLALLLLHGNPRSKQLYLVLVQRLNFKPLLLLFRDCMASMVVG